MSLFSKDTVLKHGLKDEEKLFLAKAYDTYCFSEKSASPRFTGFLSPLERSLAQKAFGESASFFGGYDDAERAVLGFMTEEDTEFPISLIESKGDFSLLTHRDFLGSIMGLGITRENVGDIIIKGDVCYIYALSKMADYIAENLISVKKSYVENRVLAYGDIFVEREFEEIKKSVASPRLDAFVASVFNLSRNDSQEAIKKGLVTLNYRNIETLDKKLKEGDTLSFKGKGKVILESFGDLSKKGRQFVLIKKYK